MAVKVSAHFPVDLTDRVGEYKIAKGYDAGNDTYTALTTIIVEPGAARAVNPETGAILWEVATSDGEAMARMIKERFGDYVVAMGQFKDSPWEIPATESSDIPQLPEISTLHMASMIGGVVLIVVLLIMVGYLWMGRK